MITRPEPINGFSMDGGPPVNTVQGIYLHTFNSESARKTFVTRIVNAGGMVIKSVVLKHLTGPAFSFHLPNNVNGLVWLSRKTLERSRESSLMFQSALLFGGFAFVIETIMEAEMAAAFVIEKAMTFPTIVRLEGPKLRREDLPNWYEPGPPIRFAATYDVFPYEGARKAPKAALTPEEQRERDKLSDKKHYEAVMARLSYQAGVNLSRRPHATMTPEERQECARQQTAWRKAYQARMSPEELEAYKEKNRRWAREYRARKKANQLQYEPTGIPWQPMRSVSKFVSNLKDE